MRRTAPLALAASLLALAACAGVPSDRERAYFSPETVARHDAFVVPSRTAALVGEALSVAFAAAFLAFGLNRKLRRGCDAGAKYLGAGLARVPGMGRAGRLLSILWGDGTWAGALLFVLGFLLLDRLVQLPIDLGFGWLWERRFGTSVESLGRWGWDSLKGLLVEAASLSLLAFGLYGLARRRRDWWLLLGVPSAMLMLALGGVLDPLRPQVYYDHEPLPEGEAKARIAQALAKAGVEYEDVFQQRMRDVTRRMNAYIAGDGPTRRIVVFDTLAEGLSPDEAASAIAHEIGHLRDRWPGRLLFASLAVLPLLAGLAWALRRLGRSGRLGFEDDRDVASLPMVFLLLWAVGAIASPIASGYSRTLERRADRFALELLGEPEAYRAMLVKVARSNLADVHPPAWVRVLLADHPPVMERIEAVERFAQEKGIRLAEPRPERFDARR